MATDKTYPSGLRRVGVGTAADFHAEHGSATPDSIEAAVQQAIGKALNAESAAGDAVASAEQAQADAATVRPTPSNAADLDAVTTSSTLTSAASFTNGPAGAAGGVAVTTRILAGSSDYLTQVLYEWPRDSAAVRVWMRRKRIPSIAHEGWSPWTVIGPSPVDTSTLVGKPVHQRVDCDTVTTTSQVTHVHQDAHTNAPAGAEGGAVVTVNIVPTDGSNNLHQTYYEWSRESGSTRVWTRRKRMVGMAHVGWSPWTLIGPAEEEGPAPAVSTRERWAAPYLWRGLDAGTLRYVGCGASKSEIGAWGLANRPQNLLAETLRGLLPASGNQGIMLAPYYIPTFYSNPEEPTRSGAWEPVTDQGGPGARLVRVKPSEGSGPGQVAWTARQASSIHVSYQVGPDQGIIEVLIDGAVVDEISTAAATVAAGKWNRYDVTPGLHAVTVRLKAGQTAAALVGAVEWRTSDTGVRHYDFGHAGHTTAAVVANPLWWEELAAVNPHLITVQYGHNDMNTPAATFRQSIADFLALVTVHAPEAGVLWSWMPDETDRGKPQWREYAGILAEELRRYPRAQVVWESEGFGLAVGADADPLNVWADEPSGVHQNAAGSEIIADLWVESLLPRRRYPTLGTSA